MDKDQLQKLWEDPAHWTVWSYNCPEDPRVIVPKRNPAMGWTVNAAHKKAPAMIIVGLLISLAPPLFILLNEGTDFSQVDLLGSIIVSAVALVAFCLIFSRKR